MSYSISNVCAEAGMENVLRWVHLPMPERELRNRVKNKMIRPTTIPQTLESLVFEQAVAREALRLAYLQHKEFATGLKGVQTQRSVGEAFDQARTSDTLVDNLRLDLLVGSGGVLSHAPRLEQTVAMLIDAFEPEGITQLAKDSIFMMPHLGVLASVNPQAAVEVFERDCLVMLGVCIAPRGKGRVGTPCFRVEVVCDATGERSVHEVVVGEVQRVTTPKGQPVRLVVTPARRFDCGAGPGKVVTREIAIVGDCGLILDARGRPLAMTPAGMTEWVQTLGLYEERASVRVMA
jgi:hypothetical protein